MRQSLLFAEVLLALCWGLAAAQSEPRPLLGVLLQVVKPAFARAFGLRAPRGVLVGDVAPGYPAARGGISRGDILLELNGRPIADRGEFAEKILALPLGTTVRLKVFRDGSEREIPVILSPPGPRENPSRVGAVPKGVQVAELTPQIALRLGVRAGAATGLRATDILQEANRKPVTTIAELERAVRLAGENPILLLISREGYTFFQMSE